jgi:hypothetical protein
VESSPSNYRRLFVVVSWEIGGTPGEIQGVLPLRQAQGQNDGRNIQKQQQKQQQQQQQQQTTATTTTFSDSLWGDD